MKFNTSILLLFSVLIFQNSIVAQSYYPLDNGQKWTYRFTEYDAADANRTNINGMMKGNQVRNISSSTEITFEILKDSIINGKTYKVILNRQDPFDIKLIREENGNFFNFNKETFKEDNFLKTAVNVDDVWLDYENMEQTIATLYIVVAKETTMQIKGKTYNDVIGIGKITAPVQKIISILQSENPFLAVTYYAKGQGMIFSYLPYPMSDRYSDLEITIVK